MTVVSIGFIAISATNRHHHPPPTGYDNRLTELKGCPGRVGHLIPTPTTRRRLLRREKDSVKTKKWFIVEGVSHLS